MTDEDASNLGGAWFGAYRMGAIEVAFIALLEDRGGALAGRISEPDRFAGTGGLLHATLDGRRDGESIRFRKTYDGAARVSHAVAYAGVLSEAGQRIDGAWRIGSEGDSFFMTRSSLDAAEAEDALGAAADDADRRLLDATRGR